MKDAVVGQLGIDRLDGDTGIVFLIDGDPSGPEDLAARVASALTDEAADEIRSRGKFRRFLRRLSYGVRHEQAVVAAREHYAAAGEFSPLHHVTGAQADGIASRLGGEGYVAVRLGTPTFTDAVQLMRRENSEKVVVVWASTRDDVRGRHAVAAFREVWHAAGGGVVVEVGSLAECDEVRDVIALSIRETLAAVPTTDEAFVLACVGAPPGDGAFDAEDVADRAELLGLVDDAVRASDRTMASGLHVVSSLERSIDEATLASRLDTLVGRGVRHLVIVPLGFIADQIMTVRELDLLVPRLARERGIRVYRAPTLNDRSEFLDAVARHVLLCRHAASLSVNAPVEEPTL